MRLRTVAWASCLAPLLGGCNMAYYAARNIVNEPTQACDNVSRTSHLRKEAREAWREVREQFPRKCFTAEFRDGFVDGYVDYLDRGGNAQPPVVPPRRYTRNDYLTPEGHLLIKDYFLGFRYGLDVAVASGKRQYLVVPVLVPEKGDGPAAFNVPPRDGADPGPAPLPPPRPVPPTPGLGANPPAPPRAEPPAPRLGATPAAPRAAAPVAVPRLTAAPKPGTASPLAPLPQVPAPDGIGSKFGGSNPPPEPETEPQNRLPRPNPPLPLPAPRPVTEPAGADGPPAGLPAIAAPYKLPDPPPEVPDLPAHVPTPSILDDLPMVPVDLTVTPPKGTRIEPPKAK